MVPQSCLASFVYAQSTKVGRRNLWNRLVTLAPSSSWVVAGDFNVIAALDEGKGNSLPDGGAIQEFTEFINDQVLLEIPMSGGEFTWTAMRRTGRVWKNLDRFLFNQEWLQHFPVASLQIPNRTSSDHNPLLFQVGTVMDSVKKSFRFQHMWVRRPDFLRVVHESWTAPIEGYGMLLFSLKLRRLKAALREWNKNEFGNVHSNVANAEKLVKEKELVFDRSGLDADLLALNEHRKKLSQYMLEEETFWWQKSRIRYLKEGDSKMGIFKIQNCMRNWLEMQDAIAQEAVDFFQSLLAEDQPPS